MTAGLLRLHVPYSWFQSEFGGTREDAEEYAHILADEVRAREQAWVAYSIISKGQHPTYGRHECDEVLLDGARYEYRKSHGQMARKEHVS